MSKKIQVFGIEIDNHTIREIMFLLEEYVNSDGLNLVAVVTPDLLMAASENEEVLDFVKMMDLHIIGDSTILEVQEERFEQQASELQRRELEETFLNSLIRKRKTVYWLSDYENDLPILKDYMAEHYPKLNIQGTYAGEVNEENIDSIINEINSVAPDVVFYQSSSQARHDVLIKHKNRLNTRLCICMGYRIKSKYWSLGRTSKIKSLIDQTMFKRKVIRYEMENKNGG